MVISLCFFQFFNSCKDIEVGPLSRAGCCYGIVQICVRVSSISFDGLSTTLGTYSIFSSDTSCSLNLYGAKLNRVTIKAKVQRIYYNNYI